MFRNNEALLSFAPFDKNFLELYFVDYYYFAVVSLFFSLSRFVHWKTLNTQNLLCVMFIASKHVKYALPFSFRTFAIESLKGEYSSLWTKLKISKKSAEKTSHTFPKRTNWALAKNRKFLLLSFLNWEKKVCALHLQKINAQGIFKEQANREKK